MDIDLAEDCLARIDEAVRCPGGNDDDAARFHLTLFVADGDRRATLDRKGDFDVGMGMQRRALPVWVQSASQVSLYF